MQDNRIQEIRAQVEEIGEALGEGYGENAYQSMHYALANSGINERLKEYFARSFDNEVFLLNQLAEAQRREQAAVALIPRECSTCAHWDKSKGKPYSCKLGGCSLFSTRENWQWSGLQAGKGEAE